MRAARDTTLISLGREQFELLMRDSAAFALALSRGLAGRVVDAGAGVPAAVAPRSFAVLALDRSVDSASAAHALAAALPGAVPMEPGPGGEESLRALARLEAEHRHVVVAASGWDEWTAFCLHETDCVVALAGRETLLERALRSEALRGCELVLVGVANGDALVDRLEPRSVRSVRAAGDVPRVMRELARRAAGRSVGLVLSGGGARAFSHLGVIDELVAAGIEIERVAGVSLGAVVAALLAQGGTPEEIHARLQDGFITHNLTNGYAVPSSRSSAGRRPPACSSVTSPRSGSRSWPSHSRARAPTS